MIEDIGKPNFVCLVAIGLVSAVLPKLLPEMRPALKTAIKVGISLITESEAEAERELIEALISSTIAEIDTQVAQPTGRRASRRSVARSVAQFKRRARRRAQRRGADEHDRRRRYRRHLVKFREAGWRLGYHVRAVLGEPAFRLGRRQPGWIGAIAAVTRSASIACHNASPPAKSPGHCGSRACLTHRRLANRSR